MTWDPCEWLGPTNVVTPEPDLRQSAEKYLGLSLVGSERVVKTEGRDTVVRLVERLELIDHLETVTKLMMPYKRVKPSLRSEHELVVEESMCICGHDFAGFDHDVDALIVYLLLTCVDTAGDDEDKHPLTWLMDRGWPQHPDISALEEAHRQECGMGRRFRSAFTDELDDATKDRIANDLAVVKLVDGAVAIGSAEAWERRPTEARVKAIATHLWEMRSKFTHTSLRSFGATTEVRWLHATAIKEKVLIRRKSSPTLTELLKDVIRQLADKLLFEGRPR